MAVHKINLSYSPKQLDEWEISAAHQCSYSDVIRDEAILPE